MTASAKLPLPAPSLDDVLDRAAQSGVAIEAHRDDGDIWIDSISRGRDASPGQGRHAIRALQAYAASERLTLSLAFWALNSALRAYYESLGFTVIAEPTDLDSADDYATAQWTPDRLSDCPTVSA